jgi:hypothetical protein
MIDHVSTLCARYRILFPTRNIEAIVPFSAPLQVSPLTTSHRKNSTTLAVDLRKLLNAGVSAARSSFIRLDWVSSDTERRIALIVDAVDEIVNLPHGTLQTLPLFPERLLPFCDGLLHDPDGTYRLSVRLDVEWPMTPLSSSKLWRRALVMLPNSDQSAQSAFSSNP